jgi:hypothetical protein
MDGWSRLLRGAALLPLACVAPGASAQSTDGYHSIQVFPLVVDTASFTQRFDFTNPTIKDVVVQATFLPADGTAQAATGQLACLPTTVPASSDREVLYGDNDTAEKPRKIGSATVASLRALCPALPPGSAFGMLYTWEEDADTLPYAGFSRVSNPLGIGFSVEAFPAHAFGGADTVVTGLVRRTASDTAPALQSNCFIGNLNQVTPDAPQNVRVGTLGWASVYEDFFLYRQNEATSFARGTVFLPPGRIVRLLDVFAAAGAPPGDYENVSIRFRHLNESPALVTFCTVQDNTSYGADFRIGKQEWSNLRGIGTDDWQLERNAPQSASVFWAQRGLVDHDWHGHAFEIAAGPANANSHVVLFRHPDYVSCALYDPDTGAALDASYGLEMRLLETGPQAVVAGGNDVTAFGDVFLGDKHDRGLGSNTIYTVEVESRNGTVDAPLRYALRCRSGSGHPNWYTISRYQDPADRF